jgi:hypothetical protein
MFKLAYTQKNIKVSSFKINECNKYIYIDNGSNVDLIDNKYSIKHYDYLSKSAVEFILNGNIWIGNLDKFNTTIYNIDNQPIVTVDFIAAFPSDIKNFSTDFYIYPTIYLNGDFENTFCAKVSKSDFNIIETYNSNLGLNGIYLVINDGSFISKNNEEITLFNFKNEIIWQHSFSELIQWEETFIYHKIINFENKIFFRVAGNNEVGLFCIDVNTGEVLNKFIDYYEIFQDEKYIYTSKYENILCKINPEIFEVEEWNVNDLVKKNGFDNIHDHRCTAKNGLFYFTQTLGDDKAKFGVLDFNSKELIYKYEFEPKNGGISSIQVSEDRIFIHTQDNTLHIFEKK